MFIENSTSGRDRVSCNGQGFCKENNNITEENMQSNYFKCWKTGSVDLQFLREWTWGPRIMKPFPLGHFLMAVQVKEPREESKIIRVVGICETW